MHRLSAQVIDLLHKAMPSGETVPAGVPEGVIVEFEERTGVAVPPHLRSWLRVSNGPCVGAGGAYGIRPDCPFLDIEDSLRLHPAWLRLGWIPIANDGCGNEYCVVTKNDFGQGEPVIFVDAMNGEDKPTYVVASDTWQFLRSYLIEFNNEMGDYRAGRFATEELQNRPVAELASEARSRWPFNKEIVVRDDPDILKFSAATLPWEA
jgi:SMI1 / KNR4 family (SUKH-1)